MNLVIFEYSDNLAKNFEVLRKAMSPIAQRTSDIEYCKLIDRMLSTEVQPPVQNQGK